jgi:hypothetical protein
MVSVSRNYAKSDKLQTEYEMRSLNHRDGEDFDVGDTTQSRCSATAQLTVLTRPYSLFSCSTEECGARGAVVVKALHYKPAGRGFDSRCCHWNFSVT